MEKAKEIYLQIGILLEADAKDLDLTCELQDANGKPVSERWRYLWRKP